MSIINLSKNELAKAIVLFAINGDVEKIDQMKSIPSDNGDLLKDVKLIVGGVELDFENVVKRIGDQLDCAVQEKAKQLLTGRISNMISTLENMQNNIEEHSDIFRPCWKDDTE